MSLIPPLFSESTIKKHSITIRQIATGNLSARKSLKIGMNVVALCCVFFLFAQYNARGSASSGEKTMLMVAGAVGALSITTIGFWEFLVFTKEEKAEDRADGEVNENPPPLPVLKLHRGFQIVALTGTSTYAGLGMCQAITLNTTFDSIQSILFPFILLLFVIGLISDPRKKSPKLEVFCFGVFVLSEVSAFSYSLRIGKNGKVRLVRGPPPRRPTTHPYHDTPLPLHHDICPNPQTPRCPCSFTQALMSVLQFFVWQIAFAFALKGRATVAALTDANLTKFLLESVIENMMKNVAGMLFVTFRGLNCVMETRSLKECSSTLLSSMYICSYFAVFVGIKMVIGAMSERQKRDHAVSWEKLIIMKHVNIRHKVNGLFLTLTAIVGMFLFCLMESADDDTTDRAKTATMVWILGLIGTMSVIISILTETFVLVSAKDGENGGEEVKEEDVVENDSMNVKGEIVVEGENML